MVKKRSAQIGASMSFSEEVNGTWVEFKAYITTIGNDGIGPYECHGRRGFDKGHDYVEEFEVENLHDEKGQKFDRAIEEQLINAIYDDKDLSEKISDTLMEQLPINEGPDPDDLRDQEIERKRMEEEDLKQSKEAKHG